MSSTLLETKIRKLLDNEKLPPEEKLKLLDSWIPKEKTKDENPLRKECNLERLPHECSIFKHTSFKTCIGCGHHFNSSKIKK